MSIILAPYNEAMRLGMGFNSFTQQLCIDNAVKVGAQPATEADLHPVASPAANGNSSQGTSSTTQEVTWTAKFVDRVSEVTDNLNISGSLQIKCDAISGGGAASASFVDMKKFKESDINYFIQVRVTNQRLGAPNLTEFDPITDLPETQFSTVYGDSFISGYTEGGEFNALVSIKLKDHSKKNEIRGKLQVALNLDSVNVKGSVKGGKENSSVDIDGETTISVSWRGGGEIKDKMVTDWTSKSLKDVAMAFPEHVMANPLRTHAILTKYTSLKSFYTKKIKGSPIDYENASVYASALLDAYTDYKVIWRNIHTGVSEVQEGRARLEKSPSTPAELKEIQEFYKQNPPPTTSPVRLEPYNPTILGLELARKDCRFEMIKIVKEVDAVTADPKVALDVTRIRQYIYPPLFSMLLPTVVSLIPETHDQSQSPTTPSEGQKKIVTAIQQDVKTLTGRVDAVENAQHALEAKVQNGNNGPAPNPNGAGFLAGLINKDVRFIYPSAPDFSVDYDKNNDAQDPQSLHRVQNNDGPNQKWKIQKSAEHDFLILHVNSGKYMVAGDDDGGQRFVHLDAHGSHFKIEETSNQTVRIRLLDHPELVLQPIDPGTPEAPLALVSTGGEDPSAVWAVAPSNS